MTPALLPMAGALGPAAAAAGDLSGPVRLADSVLAARNHAGATCPCQGEWLRRPPPPLQAPSFFLSLLLPPHPSTFTALSLGDLTPCDFSLPPPRLMLTVGPIRLWALGGRSWGAPMLPSSCPMAWSLRLEAPCPLDYSPSSSWIPQFLTPLC